jgi:hypothetical protein
MQLLPIGEQLHTEVNSANPSQDRINALLASIYQINERLTAFEDDFSGSSLFEVGSNALKHAA